VETPLYHYEEEVENQEKQEDKQINVATDKSDESTKVRSRREEESYEDDERTMVMRRRKKKLKKKGNRGRRDRTMRISWSKLNKENNFERKGRVGKMHQAKAMNALPLHR
jgi:hypothetical protein